VPQFQSVVPWLGTPIKLKLDTMQRRGYRAELLPTA